MRGGVDALVWRIPRDHFDYSAFLKAEGTQYFSGKLVRHDGQVSTQLEGRYRVKDRFSVTLDLQGYYLDQVFDVSDTDVTQLVAELRATGLRVAPTLHWDCLSSVWIESGVSGTRETFPDGTFNAKTVEPMVRIGWQTLAHLRLTVEATEARANYDRRPRYTSSGRVDPTGILATREPALEGRIESDWGAARQFKSTTRVGTRRYVDNGSGYLNYRQKHIGEEIEWTVGKWVLQLEGDASRRDYELQTVDRGTSPPPQIKDQYTLTGRVERKLSDRWTIFTEYNWERSRSNDTIASYVVNESLLGARWSWEK